MSRISYFLRGLKKVLLHTYVVAGRRLLKNTVYQKHKVTSDNKIFDAKISFLSSLEALAIITERTQTKKAFFWAHPNGLHTDAF